jgi:hypothetical protein
MYNESKRSFIVVLTISLVLHCLLVLALLLMRYDNHFHLPQSEHILQEHASAPVIFKALPQQQQQNMAPQQQPSPPEKTLPTPLLPLLTQQEEKQVAEIKVPVLLTSGDAASIPATNRSQHEDVTPLSQQPAPQNNKPLVEEKEEEPTEETILEHNVPTPEPQKLQEQPQDSTLISATGHNKAVFNSHTSLAALEVTTSEQKRILEKPCATKQLTPSHASSLNKKITLAQIANNFLQRPPSEYNGTGISTTSNHVATVIGGPAGAATEDQLRYERYAVKLMNCINTSFAILVRHFSFTSTPSTAELSFTFVMDINTKGDIVSLAIRQATGNQQFDDFMVKVLYHAAKSFPPLPSYFKVSSCTFPIQCIIPTAVML